MGPGLELGSLEDEKRIPKVKGGKVNPAKRGLRTGPFDFAQDVLVELRHGLSGAEGELEP